MYGYRYRLLTIFITDAASLNYVKYLKYNGADNPHHPRPATASLKDRSFRTKGTEPPIALSVLLKLLFRMVTIGDNMYLKYCVQSRMVQR